MVSPKTDKLLVNLAKIETGLSRVYEHLSKMDGFTNPVKKFWTTMKDEELGHAKVFNDIREKAKIDDSFEFEIDIDLKDLKGFVEKVNKLLEKIKKESITESEAYSFGSLIEAELDEAEFMKKITTNDAGISKNIKQIANDTKKHNLLLVNYSRGIR